MLSTAQLSLLLTLIPLVGGLALVFLGSRVAQRTALGIAIGAAILAFLAALFLATSAIPDAPQLITVISFGSVGLVHRLDSFSGYLIIGITLWVTPVLLWMTVPRGSMANGQLPSTRPLGWVLLAASLALSAVLVDNVLLMALCWGGVGFIAWCMARPEIAIRPTNLSEWLDLPLLTLGPVLFALAMIFPMRSTKTLSVFGMTGHNPFTFATGFLLILVLTFATGLYPFIIWVRRVAQGVLPEAVGTMLLLLTPLGVVMLGRMLVLLAPSNTWPTWHIGPASITLNALALILGIATVLVTGIILLFEQDLLVVTALLNALVLGWCFVAIGTGDTHALIGLTLLLLVQTLAIGSFMAVLGSFEWAERDLRVEALAGLARDMPGHFLALVLATLSIVGVPFFAGFAGMGVIDQSMLSQGGVAALAGALIWIGNALALLGMVRVLSHALHTRVAETDATVASTWETAGLLIPVAILLIIGIAPELLFIGKAPIWGPTATAAAALLPTNTIFGDLALSPLGFTLGAFIWIPGIFWALGVVAAAVVALCAGLIGAQATPSPVFVGGEVLPEIAEEHGSVWPDLTPMALSPILLPGPASWRYDLVEEDEALTDEDDADVVVAVEEDVFLFEEDDDSATEEDADAINVDADVVADESEFDDVANDEDDADENVVEGTVAEDDLSDEENNTVAEEVPSDTDDIPTPPAQRPPADQSARSRQQGKGGQPRG
jgi:formate hydrogenlyase subunit 3/multisubunit Na+/H+ antiporter MnhD subunit